MAALEDQGVVATPAVGVRSRDADSVACLEDGVGVVERPPVCCGGDVLAENLPVGLDGRSLKFDLGVVAEVDRSASCHDLQAEFDRGADAFKGAVGGEDFAVGHRHLHAGDFHAQFDASTCFATAAVTVSYSEFEAEGLTGLVCLARVVGAACADLEQLGHHVMRPTADVCGVGAGGPEQGCAAGDGADAIHRNFVGVAQSGGVEGRHL